MEKGLLRKAVSGLLPDAVLHRKKSPYPKTFDPRYEQLMRSRLDAILQEKDNPLYAIVNPEGIKQMLKNETEWPWYGQLMRRPQIMAYLLQLEFWLRHYRVQIDF